MPETPYSKFRLSDATLAKLDDLAASNGGTRSVAMREAVHYWHAVVSAAARANADALTEEEWALLGHTQAGADSDEIEELLRDGPGRPHAEDVVAVDWSQRLAMELSQMHEGRAILLESHREEQRAAKKLARKIAGWGIVRGYALYAALRYFWRPENRDVGVGACAAPEVWMSPTAKEAT